MNLTDCLRHSGTSQTELAAAVGVSQPMMWQWANGRRPVPARHCPAIERATGGLVTRGDLRADAHLIWPDVSPTPDLSGSAPHPGGSPETYRPAAGAIEMVQHESQA